ncbi:hypothetical protein M413DRAFT_250116 [Hebeloma cylindrosporum]|uniref:Uncharacterized protein n=1 Tax=Hebeloma cylindrosporum TaxID=76867 RepID=A0A0C2XJU3_HEBCY|nr:hypothetical protein M413DRAFT_250116 [Hebeloma cylindrosporum h7]
MEVPEPLEKIFEKVEQESERKAQAAEYANASRPNTTNGVPVGDKFATARKAKERRRGSISISRIGQPTDEAVTSNSQVPLTPNLASKSPFYQSQIAKGSTYSVASGASAFSNDQAYIEDDSHVTQMHHIVGRQTISAKMIPRRLSRSHSASFIPTRSTANPEPAVVIGVSVEEATVESPREAGEPPVLTTSRRSSVVARGGLRNQTSRNTLAGSKPTTDMGWLAKAKNFTQKLRKKSKIALSHPTQSYPR